MTYIGIDFSILSTAVTVFDTQYRFFSFSRDYEKRSHTKPFKIHNEIKDFVEIISWEQNKSKDYIINEKNKIRDSKTLADLIIFNIKEFISENTVIALEGFSYASKGRSFIDLVQFNSVFRVRLYEETGILPEIIAPTTLKMFAGKGNMGKKDLLEVVKTNKLKDTDFVKSKYYKYLNSKNEPIKPLDDINDSYLLCLYSKRNRNLEL